KAIGTLRLLRLGLLRVPGAHLVFEAIQAANMHHATLLIERGNRLGAQPLAFEGSDVLEGDVLAQLAENGFDEVAAAVGLGNDAVGLEVFVHSNSNARPLVWRITPRSIGEHVCAAVEPEPGDDDAGFIVTSTDRRIQSDDNAPKSGACSVLGVLDPLGFEERAG